jgi:hypothetical protein
MKVRALPLSPISMDPKIHFQKRLKHSHEYEISETEEKTVQFEGIEKYIYNKVTSKKFRKTALNEEAKERVKKAIQLNVTSSEPIKFTYPFGGYKIWRLETYPEVDWAEFMTIAYVIRYVAPILASYKPGVEVYFSSDDVVIEQIDNYPREALDTYVKTFNLLLNEFKQYFPENLKVELKQVVPDIYSPKEYEKELNELVENYKQQGITQEQKEKLKKAFEFNFNVNGKIDYSNVTQEKLDNVIEELMYPSDMYLKLSKRREFVRGEDKIVLFSNPIPNAIDIGSTNVSKAKFWAGLGVLEFNNDYFYDRILTPRQWEATNDKSESIPLDLIHGKNFQVINIYKERLKFL